MSSPKFSSDFGAATIRANVTAHARDADDAALLCAALGLEG